MMTNSTLDRMFKVMEFVANEQMAIGMPFDIKEWYDFFIGTVDGSKTRVLFIHYFGWLKGKKIKENEFYFGLFGRHRTRILLYLKDVGVTNLKLLIDGFNSDLKCIYRRKGIFRALAMLWNIYPDKKQNLAIFLPSDQGWLTKKTKFLPESIRWIHADTNRSEYLMLTQGRYVRILAKSGSLAIISIDEHYYMIEKIINSNLNFCEIAIKPVDLNVNAEVFLADIMI